MNGDEKNILYYKGNTELKVDIEFLRNEMSQFLQLDNLNFLIGAGCSSHVVDGTEKGIPGMASLYDGFFEEHADFEIAGKIAKPLFNNSLEGMLEAMEAVSIANQINEIDKDIEEKIEKVQKYIREKIVGGLNNEKIQGFYHLFYMKTVTRGRKNPVNVFTTNYDIYNEQAMDALSFPYNNGFVGTYKRTFNPASYKYAYVEDMNLSKNVWERVPNFYNLYKIHGSITWKRDGGNIEEVDYRYIDDNDTVMIYPTPLKDRATLMTPYSDLFRSMETALLRKNSVLITLGYSFSDDHINRIILNSLAIPTFKLLIFGQSNAIDRLIELNDKRIIVVNSEDKIHYFKNFVEKVMPNIQEDVQESFDIPSVASLIKAFEGKVDE